MKKPVKKSASPKRQRHQYVNFFGLIAGGLLLGWLVSFPINSVLKAEGPTTFLQDTSAEAPLSWDSIPAAVSYNIYYKESKDTVFTHLINVPADINYYVIPDLKASGDYDYKIAGIDKDNKEFIVTENGKLKLQPARQ